MHALTLPSVLLVALCAAGCDPQLGPPAVERTWTAMGSFASVAVPAADEKELDDVARTMREAVAEVEAEVSLFVPTSVVARLNTAAGDGTTIPLTPHAAAVFHLSQRAFAGSGGAFDPTVGAFMYLWGFRSKEAPPKEPEDAALAAAAALVGWQRIEVRDNAARLTLPGMKLDFGAVAKGYGVDVAFERLLAQGRKDVMVNIGGNLRCAGAARPGRSGWVVSVRDPYLSYGEGSVGTLTFTGGRATATSGRYERFVDIGGRRYAHIIDARSGQPVAGLAQVTIVANSAGEADALSTSCFVLGSAAGAAMLRSYPGASALFIPDPPEGEEAHALATPGFLDGFTPSAEWAGRVEELAP